MGNNAFETVKNNYTKESHGNRWKKILNQLANKQKI